MILLNVMSVTIIAVCIVSQVIIRSDQHSLLMDACYLIALACVCGHAVTMLDPRATDPSIWELSFNVSLAVLSAYRSSNDIRLDARVRKATRISEAGQRVD